MVNPTKRALKQTKEVDLIQGKNEFYATDFPTFKDDR